MLVDSVFILRIQAMLHCNMMQAHRGQYRAVFQTILFFGELT